MIACEHCHKSFANKNSLRTHRYKFHRDERAEIETLNGGYTHSEEELKQEPDSDTAVSVEETESEAESDSDEGIPKKDTLASSSDDSDSGKRKKPRYVRKQNKRHHTMTRNIQVGEQLLSIHNMLKDHLTQRKKKYSLIDSFLIKSDVCEHIVPRMFPTEENMKEELTEQQYTIVKVIQQLQHLTDVCSVINEDENDEPLLGILNMYLEDKRLQKT